MVKTHVDEILGEMARILGFSKDAGDVGAEFKTRLTGAATEAAVDALYAQYRDRLRQAVSQEDWEALVNARKGQLRSAKPAEDGQALEYALAYLVEIADGLDKYGFAGLASMIDDTIRKLALGKPRYEEGWVPGAEGYLGEDGALITINGQLIGVTILQVKPAVAGQISDNDKFLVKIKQPTFWIPAKNFGRG